VDNEAFVVGGGIYCLAFAGFHLAFWKLFDWPEDLRSLSYINRAVVQILNLCLTFAFVVFAVPSLVFPKEMVGTDMGRALLLLISAFWLLRAAEQVVFFGVRRLPSVVFLIVFLLGSALYAIPLLRG
jgi:hypothetical protein